MPDGIGIDRSEELRIKNGLLSHCSRKEPDRFRADRAEAPRTGGAEFRAAADPRRIFSARRTVLGIQHRRRKVVAARPEVSGPRLRRRHAESAASPPRAREPPRVDQRCVAVLDFHEARPRLAPRARLRDEHCAARENLLRRVDRGKGDLADLV